MTERLYPKELPPFTVQDDRGKHYVHVFDELSLRLVLQELDTAPDFIKYLKDKEEAVRKLRFRVIPGEEDLLGSYLLQAGPLQPNPFKELDSSVSKDFSIIQMAEDGWAEYVIREHQPRIVLTTSWVRLLQRSRLEKLFLVCGLGALVDCLHEECEAPQKSGESRLCAIDRWLAQHHRGERYVVLDDHLSGTELEGSHIDRAGRLVLCEVGVGLQPSHLDPIRRALRS